MVPQIELLESIVSTVEQNCNLGVNISLDEIKGSGGIYAELGDGYTDVVYYSKQTIKSIPVLFLCRHPNQKMCLEWLSTICIYLQRMDKYPKCETFHWFNTEVTKEPSKIGRDEDGTYHYSCILSCKIYY